MEIELDVLWNTKEQSEQLLSGLATNCKDCFFVKHTFYSIDNVHDDADGYGVIASGGDKFVVKQG